MKVILVAVLGFVTVSTVSAFIHHPEDEGHHHHHHNPKHEGEHKHKKHWECKGEPIAKNEEFLKAKKVCHHEFKQAKEDQVEGRQKGRVCKSVCSGKKMGFFDEEGQIVQSKVDELIDSMILSKEAQVEIKEKSAECATEHSSSLGGGPSDNKCTNYKPYLKCLWLSAMQVCVPQFDAEDWE